MTDEELTARALNAIGIPVDKRRWSVFIEGFIINEYKIDEYVLCPLGNDSEAFRIQCELLISTSFECAIGGPLYACADNYQVPVTDDKREAMRRAITMAAADRVDRVEED